VEDNVTKIKGKHELQFGAHFRYYNLNLLPQQVFTTGVTDFANSATALYDPSSSATNPLAFTLHGKQRGEHVSGIASYQTPLRKGLFKLRRSEDAFYFQDNIKVTPRFTVNLGIRWQLSPFVHEADGVPIRGLIPPATPSSWGSRSTRCINQTSRCLRSSGFYQNIGVKFETYKEAGQRSRGPTITGRIGHRTSGQRTDSVTGPAASSSAADSAGRTSMTVSGPG